MIIDFAAARKRILAMAAAHIEIDSVKIEASLIERTNTRLDYPELNTLINRLAEEKAADLRAIEARNSK